MFDEYWQTTSYDEFHIGGKPVSADISELT